MPKKTRQEKVLAQLRRMQEQKSPETLVQISPIESKIEVSKTISESKPAGDNIRAEDYSYVFSDLKKTAIFATVAVIFEISLSFVLNGFKFL